MGRRDSWTQAQRDALTNARERDLIPGRRAARIEAIVNVGMLKADKSAWLSNQDIREAFVAEGVEVVSRTNYLTFKVGEEDTWIGRVLFKSTQQVYRVSERLAQDCIAVLTLPSGVGELVGPNAAAWGAFNAESFKRFEDGNI